MTRAVSRSVLQLLRGVVTDPRVGLCADQEVLWRYLDQRDEAAFETLVRRHGTMVFDVCRSVLPGEADAEDAFQATFLLLTRKTNTFARRRRWPAGCTGSRTAWGGRRGLASHAGESTKLGLLFGPRQRREMT